MIQHPSKNNSQINAPILIDFRANLALFWEGFGGQDGAKMAPNRFKNRSQNRSKKWSTFGSPQDRFLNDFGPQFGGSRGVRWVSVGRLFGLLKQSWSQDEPKSSPRSPKTLPRALLEPIFDDFGLQLNGFYTQLEWFSTSNLVDFTANQPAKQPINQPTKQPAHETIHPNIPTSLGPGAGRPKAIGYVDVIRRRAWLQHACMNAYMHVCVRAYKHVGM